MLRKERPSKPCLRCSVSTKICDSASPDCKSCQIAHSKCNRDGHVGADVFSLFRPVCDLRGRLDPSNPRDLGRARFIGSGSFAENYRAELRESGTVVAIKYPQRRNTSRLHQLSLCIREALQWATLQHSNVALLVGLTTDPSESLLCIVTTYMEMGNVLQYLTKEPQVDRLKLLSDVAQGLDYLHSRNPSVVHGGLKAKNVLVTRQGTAILTDVGISFLVEELESASHDTAASVVTNARWYSPERLRPDLYDRAIGDRSPSSDIYSMSMTFLEILTGREPFSGYRNDFQVIALVYDRKTPEHPGEEAVQRGLDERLWSLMLRCWDSRPERRPLSIELASFFPASFVGQRTSAFDMQVRGGPQETKERSPSGSNRKGDRIEGHDDARAQTAVDESWWGIASSIGRVFRRVTGL